MYLALAGKPVMLDTNMQEKADADAAAAEGTSQMWVAQKYIEQPLIINRR